MSYKIIVKITVFMAAMVISSLTYAMSADKVEICHFTGSAKNPVNRLSVAPSAVAKHAEKHGDVSPLATFNTLKSPTQEVADDRCPKKCGWVTPDGEEDWTWTGMWGENSNGNLTCECDMGCPEEAPID